MELDLTNGAAPAQDIVDSSTASFATDVIAESSTRPVLVDFWAPWCGPCKQLTPVLEKVVTEAKGRVKLVKLNIDEHPEIPGQMGIQSIPAIVAFVDGQPKDGFMGVQPEAQINQFIDRLAGPAPASAADEILEQGEAALAAQDYDGAIAAFSAVLQAEQANLAAIGGMIKALAGGGAVDQAREIVDALDQEHRTSPEIKAAETALELAEQAADLGDAGQLLAQIEADPADHQARLDLAVLLNAGGDRMGAIEQLIASIGQDADWQEGAARKQLLTFFDLWGMSDPATLKGRRRLSSLLFS